MNNFLNLKLTPQNNSKSTYFKRRTPCQSEITIEEIQTSTPKKLYNLYEKHLDNKIKNSVKFNYNNQKYVIKFN